MTSVVSAVLEAERTSSIVTFVVSRQRTSTLLCGHFSFSESVDAG